MTRSPDNDPSTSNVPPGVLEQGLSLETMEQGTGVSTSPFGTGRHGVAKLLASSTDKTTMVFRRYDELALRNILCLSDKLSGMEKEADDDRLAEPVREYYEALRLYSEILKLGAPASRTTETLHDWLRHFRGDREGPENRYRLKTQYGKHYSDLITLYTPAEDDLLSRMIYTKFPFLFIDPKKSVREKKDEEGQYYADEGKIRVFVTIVNMVLAVALLVGAMWVLSVEGNSMVIKLATVTAFVFGFAFWVGFFTSAGRKELISATSAYAAVLVVYVGSTTPNEAA